MFSLVQEKCTKKKLKTGYGMHEILSGKVKAVG